MRWRGRLLLLLEGSWGAGVGVRGVREKDPREGKGGGG